MSAIKENGIFYLQKLVKNVEVKHSTATPVKNDYQMLCLVLKNDTLLLRYVAGGETILKTIKFFEGRRIQDVCFDDTGTWLLVLCYDNTIHVVPALYTCDKSAKFKLLFSASEISSFTVPFSPPHECPNPQSCPNQFDFGQELDFERFSTRTVLPSGVAGATSGSSGRKVNEAIAANSLYNQFYCETGPPSSTAASQGSTGGESCDAASNNNNNNDNSLSINQSNSKGSTPIDSQILSSSLESSCICPYPKCCVWWQTNNGDQRAIIGYSEGTICIVRLTINCPFIGTCSVERGNIEQLVICRDNNSETVTLMINTSMTEQWKLLLEQKSIGYTYPDNFVTSPGAGTSAQESMETGNDENPPENWQFVVNLDKKDPQADTGDESFEQISADEASLAAIDDQKPDGGALPKSISAAKARLQSLRDIGAKKIGTLKLKLAESRLKSREREKSREQAASLALMETPSTCPEILTTPSGPYFIVQHTQDRHLLSALHSYSDTLSVHSMDISLIPLFLYKIPRNCRNLLLTQNLIYTIQTLVEPRAVEQDKEVTPTNEAPAEQSGQEKKSSLASSADIENVISTISSHDEDEDDSNSINLYNGFGVVSCNMAVTKLGADCDFHDRAQVALYKFEDEQIINLHHMLRTVKDDSDDQTLQDSLNSSAKTENLISNYFNMKNDLKKPMFSTNFMSSDANVLQNKFPTVNFEQCFVITDKNVYSLELTEPPHIIFLKLVDQAAWTSCEEFCNIFNLSLPNCIEFAGDVLLRKKKVTKALLTYNIARIPPIKTALKLAMFGEVNALMHLCAMAIKNTFLLNSKYLIHPNMKYLVDTAHLRHQKYEALVKNKNKAALKAVNTGKLCSDFSYETDEITSDLQMSSSSQFHLSNLLFLSLTERCVKDKNYVPLWNFIATNSKFHTSLACVVLSQSGLYSTAILLAMMRGACLDVFSCLVSAADQVLDVGQEWNFYMYNLSEEMFMESIIYLQDYAMEYFEAIRKNITKLDLKNLERLEKQLNPFQVVYKPVMAKMLACKNEQEHEKRFMEFCKYFIETYVIILIQTQALKLYSDNFLSALNLFRPLYRAVDEQRVLTLQNSSPLSTGFSHAAYVLNGSVYIWGSNGVSCALSRNLITNDNNGENTSCMPTCLDFFRDLEIDVVTANCGKSHTLFMTNNGLYAMGANNLGQLGIGKTLIQALQPMLVRTFEEGQVISQVYAGQYHNAAVVDDLLYMWGWGVYGQLGNGNVENEYTPKVVEFFRGKKILQVALGHAHTLVLCRDDKKSTENSLYVFGSNHYGQLGISQDNDTVSSSSSKSLMKSLVPVRLDVGEEVKIIHTKYFSNLVVSTTNQLYTWGASPQAIRLSTQAKKRARANLRNEENSRTDRVTVVNEPMESKEAVTTVVVEDDPDDDEDDDVFVEKANEESQEKEIKDTDAQSPTIPEIKVDLAPPSQEIVEPISKTEQIIEPKDALIDECTDHLRPSLILCEEPIMSDILHIATGLYHYTAVTADGSLYTWGKNLERQLGREGSRNEILYPTKLENVSNVRDVACGADFTIILLHDGTIKACGQNNNGQCGLEIAPLDKSGIAGKLVRLRLSKRLVRIPDGSQCIEVPTVVKFPTDEAFSANHTVYTLKSLPKYQPNCVIKSSLAALPLFSQVSGHTTIDSNLNEFCKDEIPDLIRNLENQNLVDANQNEAKMDCETPINCTNNVLINGSISGQSTVSTPANLNKFSMENIFTNDFIHYCLYIFHGLYDHAVISDFSARQLAFKEYKLRVLMLNFSYIDAFKLCIADCMDAQKCIRLFEYFTKDPVILPLHEEDLKYFIYEIFRHFIRHQMNLALLEDFLLQDLNYYLIQLSYVLYFNNSNSTALEKNVFLKFKNLFTNFDNVTLENTDVIFKMISTKFNVVVCQRLIEAAENFQT
ncbi:uncharacterized protein LOC134833990 [Culicoides brevitarsis]|uniref:uncharacterized protein LOC134833990 n=1 Tax=Culicoides brevitarsis TaxID=469753 RepID=UPI00307BE236